MHRENHIKIYQTATSYLKKKTYLELIKKRFFLVNKCEIQAIEWLCSLVLWKGFIMQYTGFISILKYYSSCINNSRTQITNNINNITAKLKKTAIPKCAFTLRLFGAGLMTVTGKFRLRIGWLTQSPNRRWEPCHSHESRTKKSWC